MFLLDANILIGAFRRDDPKHTILKVWLEETLDAGLTVTFPPLVEKETTSTTPVLPPPPMSLGTV